MSSFRGNLSSVRRLSEYFSHGPVNPVDLVGGRREQVAVAVHGHLKRTVTKEFLKTFRRCAHVDHYRGVEVTEAMQVIFSSGLAVMSWFDHPDPQLDFVQ